MDILGDIKNSKKLKQYYCKKCDYNTCNKNDYNRHLQTIKHKSMSAGDIGDSKNSKKLIYICEKCEKKYNSNNGLWKHKKKCENQKNAVVNQQGNTNDITEDKVQQLTDIIKLLLRENSEIKNLVLLQQNTVTELVKNGIINNTNNTTILNNSNNKTFNLHFFLNETCKDAMNMSEFINSLQIEYDDFEKVGEMGFVNGISNIIIKNLKHLDVTQRPLHCTDKKREVVYVKEDNKWEKEDENHTKTRKLIQKTAEKNIRLLPEFKKRHPDYATSTSIYSDKYDLLIIETMGGSGDNDFKKETRILKYITKEVVINKVF
jgi:hypothetical protein